MNRSYPCVIPTEVFQSRPKPRRLPGSDDLEILALQIFNMAKLSCILVLVIQINWQLIAFGGESVHVAHMKPFGAHMPPENVDEFTDENLPAPQEFWKKYVKKRKPVVFRGAASNSPAFKKWTDDFLADKYGNFEVRLEARKEKQGYIPIGDVGVGRDTIRNFIKTYHTSNKYIVSELPRPMYDDIMVIPPMSCGEFSRRIVEVDWWMNGGNASSIIHKDAFNQINCLMNGTKEWKLVEYKYEKSIYKAWEPEREIGGYSRIHPEQVDLLKYPKVATVPWMFTTLNGGDCLYLPGSMYHQVKSYGTNNFAVSLLFSRFDERRSLDFADCGNDSPSQPQYKPLGSLDVDWQYPGSGDMTMGEPDLEFIRGEVRSLIKRKGPFVENFAKFLLKMVYEGKSEEWLLKKADEVSNKVKSITGKDIDKKSIKTMSKEALRVISLALQPIDASNTYDHEYTYVSPDGIINLLQDMLRRDGKIARSNFVKRYEKELFGTSKFANDVFSKIAGESANEATREQVQANVERAIEKYNMFQRSELEPPQGETTQADAYDTTNEDTEMFETGMPDMSDDDDDAENSQPNEDDIPEDTGNGVSHADKKDEL